MPKARSVADNPRDAEGPICENRKQGSRTRVRRERGRCVAIGSPYTAQDTVAPARLGQPWHSESAPASLNAPYGPVHLPVMTTSS